MHHDFFVNSSGRLHNKYTYQQNHGLNGGQENVSRRQTKTKQTCFTWVPSIATMFKVVSAWSGMIPMQDFLRKHAPTSSPHKQRCDTFFHWVHTLSLIIIITTVLFVTQLLFYVNFAFLTGFNSKCSASIADFFMWESPRTLSCALFCCKARRKR